MYYVQLKRDIKIHEINIRKFLITFRTMHFRNSFAFFELVNVYKLLINI